MGICRSARDLAPRSGNHPDASFSLTRRLMYIKLVCISVFLSFEFRDPLRCLLAPPLATLKHSQRVPLMVAARRQVAEDKQPRPSTT